MRRALASICVTTTVVVLACAKPAQREHVEVDNQDERDRYELIDLLDREVRALDKQISALETEAEGDAERERLSARRDLLRSDREEVRSATEAGWRVTKERAERDLKSTGPGRI